MKQQGTYNTKFSIAAMSHDQWRTFYWLGCPSWRRPMARLVWNGAQLDLRVKLFGHGVSLKRGEQ